MATATKSTKSTKAEAPEVELTDKQVINAAVDQVLEATGTPGQHNRYKAMRAIAYQAFVNAIADGSFDDLVAEAIANADDLPSGWELERAASDEKPAKAPAKAKAAAKPAAKAPAKEAPAVAKRPARKPRPTR